MEALRWRMVMEDDGVDPLQTPVVQAPVPVTPISSTSSDTSGDGCSVSSRSTLSSAT